jgi:hypothetical protein
MKDGRAAAFVYCCGLAYSGKHGTDGFIPASALPRLNGRKVDAERLVEAGLWHAVEGGWDVNGWAEYNPTTDSSARVRAAKRAGSSKGNCIRWHGPDCGCWKQRSDSLRAVPGGSR